MLEARLRLRLPSDGSERFFLFFLFLFLFLVVATAAFVRRRRRFDEHRRRLLRLHSRSDSAVREARSSNLDPIAEGEGPRRLRGRQAVLSSSSSFCGPSGRAPAAESPAVLHGQGQGLALPLAPFLSLYRQRRSFSSFSSLRSSTPSSQGGWWSRPLGSG